jgi:hypothetical protein
MRRGSLGLTKVDDSMRNKVRQELVRNRNVPSPSKAAYKLTKRKKREAAREQLQKEAQLQNEAEKKGRKMSAAAEAAAQTVRTFTPKCCSG